MDGSGRNLRIVHHILEDINRRHIQVGAVGCAGAIARGPHDDVRCFGSSCLERSENGGKIGET